jgi:hypothetical protein
MKVNVMTILNPKRENYRIKKNVIKNPAFIHAKLEIMKHKSMKHKSKLITLEKTKAEKDRYEVDKKLVKVLEVATIVSIGLTIIALNIP